MPNLDSITKFALKYLTVDAWISVGITLLIAIFAVYINRFIIRRLSKKWNSSEYIERLDILRASINFIILLITIMAIANEITYYKVIRFLRTEEYKVTIAVLWILAGSYALSALLKMLLERYIHTLDDEKDKTPFKFLYNTLGFLMVTTTGLAIAYTIPALRTLAVTIFASAGILAAILGFASQKAFSNIVSGVFIVFFKPFRVGDYIQVGTHMGFVEDITLRHTVIRSMENRRVIIPNSTISSDTIMNSTISDPKTCKFFEVTVGYTTDLDKAINIIREIALAHPECIDNRTEQEIENNDPIVIVRTVSMAESGIVLRAYIWAKDPIAAFIMNCDLIKKIKERFEVEQIEIPYPHRTLVIKQDTALLSKSKDPKDQSFH